MRGIFNYDGPLFSGLGKVADLVILNFLVLLCCIPIFTIGPAVTAAHYVALKIVRGEGYVFKNFWKSFKENFVQSIIIEIIFVLLIGLAYVAMVILGGATGIFVGILRSMLLVSIIYTLLISLWVFPVQSKFINNVPATLKNGYFLSIKHLFRTIYMGILHLIPIILFLAFPQMFSILILCCFSVPIFLSAMAYNKVFERIEEQVLEGLEQQQETVIVEE